jgi:protein O-mannose beta-1,4-N-acetylglucosaminyltransferase
LNEAELGRDLSAAFGLPICWIRLEEMKISEIINQLRRAIAAFGMHGSILIFAAFLPPGATLIEGFPYGVPPENYTPYRTLARLRGMGLSYRSWVPTDQSASIGHPSRGPEEGGIAHLSEAEQHFILTSPSIPPHPCCDNPHWLYRIFQDTYVNASAIIMLIREGLVDAAMDPAGTE